MAKRLCATLLALVLAGGVASALDLGNNITISDGVGTGTGWYSINREDQEVEPNCVAAQIWDLEGFFLDANMLSLVSGYDLENGETGNGMLFEYGDLFIDVDGNAVYGPAASGSGGDQSYPLIVANTFGYDYVLTYAGASDPVTGDPLFNAYALNTGDTTLRVYYNQNDESNPWRYFSGGQSLFTGSFTYTTGLGDDLDGDGDADVLGGSHNAVQVDLDWLWDYQGTNWNGIITTHFTQECGNDNLMGQGELVYDPGTPVPEPASITLMGLGIALVAVARMRKAA